VQAKSFAPWWITRKNEDKEDVEVDHTQRPVPSRSNSSFWITRKTDDKEDANTNNTPPPVPPKSNSSFWITRKDSKDEQDGSSQHTVPSRSNSVRSVTRKNSKDEKENTLQRTATLKSGSDSKALTTRGTPKPPTPSRSNSGESEHIYHYLSPTDADILIFSAITTVTHAPTWLLDACNALDFLTSEHPKVMSTLSAILITAGSLPAIPAISAGAGGAVLASGAAHAVGAIAVGLGSWLKAQQEGQIRASTTQSVSTVSTAR